MAIWLAIVPLGTKSAASLPSIAAARSWRAWTVGSSPSTSSPNSAERMASHMLEVGRVTVSERRSTKVMASSGVRGGSQQGA